MRSAARMFAIVLLNIIAGGTSLPARAEEMRPMPDAELLMARYASDGGVVTFAAPDSILKTVPDIAIYSDGTVLIADSQRMPLPLNMRVAVISADISQSRFKEFYKGLADAESMYPYNCWNTRADGTQVPLSCVDDASTANILLRIPETGRYKSIAVVAGYTWQHMQGMRKFAPSAYFDLMAWMDGLKDLPSQPWQSTASTIPRLAPTDPACLAAQDLCQ